MPWFNSFSALGHHPCAFYIRNDVTVQISTSEETAGRPFLLVKEHTALRASTQKVIKTKSVCTAAAFTGENNEEI